MLKQLSTWWVASILLACGGADPSTLKSIQSEVSTLGGGGLRIVNQNIAGLRLDKVKDPVTGGHGLNQQTINQTFAAWLQRQHGLSSVVGAKTAFALQEVTNHCAYSSSGDNFAVAEAALGNAYAGGQSSDLCKGGGSHGDAVLTNATILRSESLNFSNVDFKPHQKPCYKLSIHAMQVQVAPALRPWIVSVHYDLLPHAAVAQFKETIAWLKRIVGRRDWDRVPIVIIGDFNIVARGWDRVEGADWAPKVVCEGVTDQFGNAVEAMVGPDDHIKAFASVEAYGRKHGFQQVLGVKATASVWSGHSFHAWNGKRRIDYAYVRNAPCENCVVGHLTPPTSESSLYFADHTGLVVTMLPPRQARQRTAQNFLLTQ